MTKGYVAKEINKVVETLALHEGNLRQRVKAALTDIKCAYASANSESLFQSELGPIKELIESANNNGLDSASDSELREAAAAFLKIDGLLCDWLKAKPK